MHRKRILFLLGLVSLAVFLSACEQDKIGDINADPGRYQNKEVHVAGKVTQSIGVLNRGIYQIDDGTGTLWVFSDSRGVPSKGAMIGVQGKVTPTVTFLGINYATVMRESGRKAGS